MIDDEMVKQRWGQDVRELFHATLAMEMAIVEDTKDKEKETTGLEDVKGEVEALESDEARREREILEGAIEDRPGFVAMAGGIRQTQSDEGEGDENEEHVMHEDGEEDDHRDEDAAAMMQLTWASTFSDELQRLLQALEGMRREEAGQKAAFLLSMLRDLQRPSPHLRHPTLIQRQNRVEALLSGG